MEMVHHKTSNRIIILGEIFLGTRKCEHQVFPSYHLKRILALAALVVFSMLKTAIVTIIFIEPAGRLFTAAYRLG